MIISCYRCGKGIDTPNAHNADYVIASDTIVRESREVLIALKHNPATLEKQAMIQEKNPDDTPKYPGLTIADDEYDEVEVSSIEAGESIGEDLVRIKAKIKDKDIQKTGIICPDCYRDSDLVIWGVHKKMG